MSPLASLIITAVSEYYDVSLMVLESRSRHPSVVEARHVLFAILYRYSFSYASIGRIVDRDHTSVIYGVKHANEKFADDIHQLVTEIKSQVPNGVLTLERYENAKRLGLELNDYLSGKVRN